MENKEKLNEQQLEDVTGGVTPDIRGLEGVMPVIFASKEPNGEELKSNLGERRPG